MKIIPTDRKDFSFVKLETYDEVFGIARHLNPPLRRLAAFLGATSASGWLEPTPEAVVDANGKWLPLITPEAVPDARLANAAHALLKSSIRTGGSRIDPVADRELASRINAHFSQPEDS